MASMVGYTSLRARLRVGLNHRERVLGWFRILRYVLVQGPWRPYLIRYHAAKNANPPLPVRAETMFGELDAAAAGNALDRDALTERFLAPDDTVAGIVDWVRTNDAKRIDDPHVDCEGVTAIAHDPRVIAVARRFLGAEPILFTSKIYWTLPRPDARGRVAAAAEGGQFHYDLADVKAVTLFVYLTDVDEESGPHVAVRGSQRRVTPDQILRRTISDELIARRYPGRTETVLGPRGTCWFEDITCYHKQAVGTKPRLMLSIIYSLHRRPLDDLEMRPASGNDSRPADRLRRAEIAAGSIDARATAHLDDRPVGLTEPAPVDRLPPAFGPALVCSSAAHRTAPLAQLAEQLTLNQ